MMGLIQINITHRGVGLINRAGRTSGANSEGMFPPFATWCRITIGTEPEVSSFLDALRATVHA